MSPRTSEKNERIRKERREEILAAAGKVFTHKGYAAAKISDIAAAANVSQGLVYHYFASKEEIYAELAARIRQGAASLRHFAEQSGTPREKVHAMLDMMLAAVRVSPEYFVLAVQVMTTEGVAQSAVEEVYLGSMAGQAVMAQIIAEGQAAGAFRPGDPCRLFSLLYAVINGLAIAHVFSRHTGQVMVDVDAETIMRLIEP